jgi:hypothetical protein
MTHLRFIVAACAGITIATTIYSILKAYSMQIASTKFKNDLDATAFAVEYVAKKAMSGEYKVNDQTTIESDFEFARMMFHTR